MTRHKRKAAPSRVLRSLYMWHRWIGLASALFVMLLALTGVVLNHTESLRLDSRYLQSPALLDWYGIQAPDDIRSFRTSSATVSQVGQRVYRDLQPLGSVEGPLIGAVDFADMVVIAVAGKLLLLDTDGEQIELLGSAAGVPAGMQRLGISRDGLLAIRAAHGFYRTDDSFSQWQESTALDADWSAAQPAAEPLHSQLQQAWRGTGLDWERVLLDLHSGRIFGNAGVWLMDAAAIMFLLLAVTGLWLWGRRRASAHAHARKLRTHSQQRD